MYEGESSLKYLDFLKSELVSIGPKRGSEQHLQLNKYKHSFLEKYLSRNSHRDLSFYVAEIIALQNQVRDLYFQDFMSNREFCKQILLDGCFIIEILRHFGGSELDEELPPEDPINNIMPWQIPIMVKDLLLINNQISFLVLQKLFDLSNSKPDQVSLTTLALKFIDLAFPRSSANFIPESSLLKPIHLLDLLHKTILGPANRETHSYFTTNLKFLTQMRISDLKAADSTDREETENQGRIDFEKSAVELGRAGIDFTPNRSSSSLLNIKFNDGVVQIPTVTINYLFCSVLISAKELKRRDNQKSVIEYIYFMTRLIRDANDVKFLCSKGIISRFSDRDYKVVDMFQTLRGCTPAYIDSNSHIGKTITAIESYNAKSRKPPIRQSLMETSVVLVFLIYALLIICLFGLRYISPRLANFLAVANLIWALNVQRSWRQVVKNPVQVSVIILTIAFTFLSFLVSS